MMITGCIAAVCAIIVSVAVYVPHKDMVRAIIYAIVAFAALWICQQQLCLCALQSRPSAFADCRDEDDDDLSTA